jgi:hypothetical protein
MEFATGLEAAGIALRNTSAKLGMQSTSYDAAMENCKVDSSSCTLPHDLSHIGDEKESFEELPLWAQERPGAEEELPEVESVSFTSSTQTCALWEEAELASSDLSPAGEGCREVIHLGSGTATPSQPTSGRRDDDVESSPDLLEEETFGTILKSWTSENRNANGIVELKRSKEESTSTRTSSNTIPPARPAPSGDDVIFKSAPSCLSSSLFSKTRVAMNAASVVRVENRMDKSRIQWR